MFVFQPDENVQAPRSPPPAVTDDGRHWFGSVMGLRKFWHNNKVLIVMGTSLGLIHWGWYNLKSSPLLRPEKNDHIPEPGIVTYVLRSSSSSVSPPPPPAAAAKSK